MNFIVYREPFKLYGELQEKYFVSYKDKCSDKYSDKWFDAKRYKTIGPAITKLGLTFDKGMYSIDDFLKQNPLHSSFHRLMKIDSVNDLNTDFTIKTYPNLSFTKGRIELVDEENNLHLGNAYIHVWNYIEKELEKNVKHRDKINKNFMELGEFKKPLDSGTPKEFLDWFND